MKVSFRLCFKVVFFLLLMRTGTCAAQILTDSSTVSVRTLSSKAIESYSSQKQFQYHTLSNYTYKTNRWLNDILIWLTDNIFQNVSSEIILTILIAILLTIFFLQVSNVSFNSFFRKKSQTLPDILHSETALISWADYNALIANALNNSDFRLALRFQFLRLLFAMNERKIVSLSDEKTNYDYLKEISNHEIKKDFEPLVYSYEYVWYGEYELDQPMYNSLNTSFSKFEKALGF